MTKGTIIRTIALVLTTLNNFFAQVGDFDFGNEKVNMIYKGVSAIVNAIASGFALWYNNDFTEEACLGTAYTRHLKEVQNEDYIGEDFTSEEKEEA